MILVDGEITLACWKKSEQSHYDAINADYNLNATIVENEPLDYFVR